MRILGVDPGTIITGYSVIEYDKNEFIRIASGVIKTPTTKEQAPRLKFIYSELDKIIKQYKPDEFALETAFYGKNVQSTLKIGYARGVSMLAAVNNNLPVKEYSPREIKKSVVGSGGASKEQVQFMVKKLVAVRSVKMKFDESDAIAVSICHAFKTNTFSKKTRNWKEFIKENPGRVIE